MNKLVSTIVLVAAIANGATGATAQTAGSEEPGHAASPRQETGQPSAVAWNPERYLELVGQSDAAFERAQSLDGPARAESLSESLVLREEARGMLRSSLLAGELDEYGEAPHQDLLDLSQNAVALLLQLDRCDEAEERLDYALGDALLMPDGAVEVLRPLRESVGRCRERVAAVQAPPIEQPVEQPGAPTPEEWVEPEPPRRSVVPWVLIGTGGAMLVSALAYDLALDSDRNEFQIIQNDCRNGCTVDQHDLAVSLREDLDRAKVVTGVLYGAGLAASAVGVVLLFTRDDESASRQIALTPELGPGVVGAVMSVPF